MLLIPERVPFRPSSSVQVKWAEVGEKRQPGGGEPGDARGPSGQLLGLLGPELCQQPGDASLPAQPPGSPDAQRLHPAHTQRQQQP